jgi:hypothetical protein
LGFRFVACPKARQPNQRRKIQHHQIFSNTITVFLLSVFFSLIFSFLFFFSFSLPLPVLLVLFLALFFFFFHLPADVGAEHAADARDQTGGVVDAAKVRRRRRRRRGRRRRRFVVVYVSVGMCVQVCVCVCVYELRRLCKCVGAVLCMHKGVVGMYRFVHTYTYPMCALRHV